MAISNLQILAFLKKKLLMLNQTKVFVEMQNIWALKFCKDKATAKLLTGGHSER